MALYAWIKYQFTCMYAFNIVNVFRGNLLDAPVQEFDLSHSYI